MFKLEFLSLFLLTVETLRAEIVYDWQLYAEISLCSHDEGRFSNAGPSSSFIFHINIFTVLSFPPIKEYFISALSMRQAPWTKHLDLFSIDVGISFSLVPTLSLSALPALSRFHLLPGDLSRSMRPAAAIMAGYQVSVIFCVLPSPLSLDPLTKSWETFLKSICLSWFAQPLIQALLLSLRIWEMGFYIPARRRPHLPTPPTPYCLHLSQRHLGEFRLGQDCLLFIVSQGFFLTLSHYDAAPSFLTTQKEILGQTGKQLRQLFFRWEERRGPPWTDKISLWNNLG